MAPAARFIWQLGWRCKDCDTVPPQANSLMLQSRAAVFAKLLSHPSLQTQVLMGRFPEKSQHQETPSASGHERSAQARMKLSPWPIIHRAQHNVIDTNPILCYRITMNTIEDATRALQKAEGEIRDLMSRAASSADYGAVEALVGVAAQLMALSSALSDPSTQVRGHLPVHRASSPLVARHRIRASEPAQTPPRQRFPKFFREGTALVKLGWSKKKGQTYEQRAQKECLLTLANALASHAGSDSRFSMVDILPLTTRDRNEEFPNYQAYLCLGWLRSERLVEKSGRDSYRVPRPASLTSEALSRFEQLEGAPPDD